ncbi:MAG: hypothetical protein ACRET4_12895 [Steroidobacteraceae bacterium]
MRATDTNNPAVTPQTPSRVIDDRRFRGTVVLLALSAWIFSGFICPMAEHGMDANRSHDDVSMARGQVHEHGNSPKRPSPGLCCDLLNGLHAIAQPVATVAPDKVSVPSLAAGSAPAPISIADAAPIYRPLPHSNGPPRNLYQRFATFWSHAPPADHA